MRKYGLSSAVGENMKSLNIGLLTANLNSGNMGVNALSFSAIMLLEEASKLIGVSSKYTIFNDIPNAALARYDNLSNTEILIVSPSMSLGSKLKKILQRQILSIKDFYRAFDSCDLFFEIAGGDSFSDIYGLYRPRRFRKYHARAAKKGKPLIFLPQTIGPFQTDEAKKIASKSLSYACKIFTRDPISKKQAIELTASDKVITTIDMACFMEYDHHRKDTDRLRIGVNPSGLLWNGGYNGDNQLNLKIEYKTMIISILEMLSNKEYEIVLVPHVLHGPRHNIEDDYIVCKWLQKKYPFCEIAPFFYTPMEAKSYIAGLNLLIGSRMHCCIAAYSSGIPIYPLAYSRKFSGLFKEELDYPYGAELVSDDIESVTDGLQNVLNNLSDIQEGMPKRLERLGSYKHILVNELKKILMDCITIHNTK